jgi:thiol:disulfide interchange protein
MKLKCIFLLLFLTFSVSAQFLQPFDWSVNYEDNSGKLTVSVIVPEGHYLYADKTFLKVYSKGGLQVPYSKPVAILHKDELGSHTIYPSGKTYSWIYHLSPNAQYKVNIDFQGCQDDGGGSPAICFMPSSEEFKSKDFLENDAEEKSGNLKEGGLAVSGKDAKECVGNLLDHFKVIKSGGGYLNSAEFLDFLNISGMRMGSLLESRGFFSLVFFILLGGLMLNFTPCVLPMIPINLAIIGAGSEAKTKLNGFLKGGIYGGGIALSYGVLGVVSVLTGAKFGTLNSSPVFNFIIAAVFLVLSLAMFDIFNIDLSRYSGKIGNSGRNSGTFIAIFAMGIVAALLAGACVAPVVIAVLLYSATIYADGNISGLLLPFLLGVGMAIPWPLAGAGISVIPKPGSWMVKVKYGFGILIALFSLYYGYIGITLSGGGADFSTDSSFDRLHAGLLESQRTEKPLFIDFWASWCKNCSMMEESTFKDSAVIKRLEDFVVIKFQAENMEDPEIRKLLDRFSIPGLPGFVILKPKNN